MIAEQIKDHLVSEGFGSYETDMFIGFQPDKPDNCTVIYENTAPVLQESQGFAIDSVDIQLIVRNTSYFSARDKLKEAHLILSAYRGTLSDGTIVRETYITTPPSSIGSDDENRKEWTAHYTMNYTQTQTQLRPEV